MYDSDFDGFNFLKGFVVGVIWMFILAIVTISLRY